MSLYRMNEVEHGKSSKKLKKVISIPPVRSSSVLGKHYHDNILYTTKKHSDNRLAHSNGQMGDGKLPSWHYLMEQVFESFLLRLDDIFLTLRKKDSLQMEAVNTNNLKGYQDICEKLRMEILIAMDKLELMSLPTGNRTEGSSEFMDKMSMLKAQLSDLRWQYHNTIKDLGVKML